MTARVLADERRVWEHLPQTALTTTADGMPPQGELTSGSSGCAYLAEATLLLLPGNLSLHAQAEPPESLARHNQVYHQALSFAPPT